MTSIRAVILLAAASFAFASGARADTRIFIIENSDGYGVDSCLASGGACGERVAAAWCRSHDYARALDFGRADNSMLTPISSGSALSQTACQGPLCPTVVAITCTR